MAKEDYYTTLGVSKRASKEELKSAYKKLAKEYHPDMNKGDKVKEEKFKKVNEAYTVLSDDKAKEHYDRFGSAQPGPGQSNQGADYGSDFSFDFGDIFSSFFGGNEFYEGGRRSRRGRDLQVVVEITLEEASSGVTKQVEIEKLAECEACGGIGAKSDNDIAKCSDCKGTGQIRRTQRTPFGIFATNAPCAKCEGTGQVIKHPCPKCDGAGRVQRKKKIDIKIPAGVDNGMSLRMMGEGEAGELNSTPGNLYVVVNVIEHEIFERQGSNIACDVPISFVQATLGDEIKVPTLDGEATLKIPPGTQSHTVFKMKAKGMSFIDRYGFGDQLVKVIVQTPERLTKRQEEILREFAEAGGDKADAKKKGFFKRFGL